MAEDWPQLWPSELKGMSKRSILIKSFGIYCLDSADVED